MKRRAGQRAGGFTLIEALATIAVMMIVIPVLLQGFALADGIALATQQTADATALAQSTMEELIATQNWQLGSTAGEETINATKYQWDAMLSAYETDQNVQTLTLTVYWERRGVPRSVALTTIVYLPGSTVSSTTTDGLTGGGLGGLP
jgi:type II secretory pathway pseudopilin PulG